MIQGWWISQSTNVRDPHTVYLLCRRHRCAIAVCLFIHSKHGVCLIQTQCLGCLSLALPGLTLGSQQPLPNHNPSSCCNYHVQILQKVRIKKISRILLFLHSCNYVCDFTVFKLGVLKKKFDIVRHSMSNMSLKNKTRNIPSF